MFSSRALQIFQSHLLTHTGKLVAGCLLGLLLGGCATDKNVSNDPEYLGSLKVNGIYKLTTPAFCYDFNSNRLFFDPEPGPGLWLLPEKYAGYDFSMPSYEQFAISKKWPGVKALLPSKTQLIFKRVIYHDYIEDVDIFYLFQIVDGPLAGLEVCLNELMIPDPNRVNRPLPAPNPIYFDSQ